MRLPYSWLREIVAAGTPGWGVSPEELEHTLIRIGHEVEEIIPVGPERVRIRLPAGTRAGSVRLLTARTTPQVERGDNGVLIVTVPSVEVHEVVAIDL